MTTVMYQTPQAVRQPVIITAPPAGGSLPFIAEKYMYRAGMGLGITQAVLGVISFIFGIVFTAWAPEGYFYLINRNIGAGIWCGILFIVTGVLGILTRKKNKGLIISYMIMSIVSAVISWIVLMGISSIDLLHPKLDFYYSNVIAGLSGFFIFLGFIEGLIAVISSTICCQAICCCSKPSSQGSATYTVPNTGQNTVAYVPSGQQGFVFYPQPFCNQNPPAYMCNSVQQQQQQWPQHQPPQSQSQYPEIHPEDDASGEQTESLQQKL